MSEKSISDSFTSQTHIIMPCNVNSSFTLFGGILMQWIDETAGIVARRHSEHNACTASVDKLDFHLPAHLDDIVQVEGRVIYTGRTSMIVQVNSYVEHHREPGVRKLINTAYLTMVALDDQEKPVPVPQLKAENEKDAELLKLGAEKRKQFRQ